MYRKLLLVSGVVLGLSACQTVQQHQNSVNQANDSIGGQNLTIGTVQSQLKKGMSGGEVATVMGSPNIVSTDANGNEVWIYDKISTQRNYSESSAGTGILPAILFGGQSSAGAGSSSQKTMTVVVKFDENKSVRDIAYHTSRF
jgi:outer membrane protein assembly factor BamE (lipoprotein component of BamABCDE complex)